MGATVPLGYAELFWFLVSMNVSLIFSISFRQVGSDPATEQSPETPGGEGGTQRQVRRDTDSTALFGAQVQWNYGRLAQKSRHLTKIVK